MNPVRNDERHTAESPQAEVPDDLLAAAQCLTALRGLDEAQLCALAAEIREFLIEHVGRTGGHLGSNLGVVELTIALHRMFDSPCDILLWDTGHQAYVHKLLTGRMAAFPTLRAEGGLSPYPSQAESAHDHIENSHASTALSYADGIAKGLRLRGEDHRAVVAVVGDGALTGGMCWEAMNNLGTSPGVPVIVVLNDNGRSYDPTVGGLASHLCQLRTSEARPSIFDQLGLDYLGPIDGHDIGALETAFTRARDSGRSVVVHCITRKGNGYAPAEADQADCLHAVTGLDPATGYPRSNSDPTWTRVFGDEIVELARTRPDIVAITAAMLQPVGLKRFATTYPDRIFDVGIAEQHAVTSAAGLAMTGMHPVVALYATFLNRAFDQALLDVALHRLAVTFVLDRAGITGDDGPSHNGMWDMSIMSLLPGIRIAAPRDATTLRVALAEALRVSDGPTVLRFPKGALLGDIPASRTENGLDVIAGSGVGDVLIVSVGAMAAPCAAMARHLTAEGVTTTVVDPRWVLPVNPKLIDLAADHRLVVTVEDNNRTGGIGTVIDQAIAQAGIHTPVYAYGIEPTFLNVGSRASLLAQVGLTGDLLARSVARLVDQA